MSYHNCKNCGSSVYVRAKICPVCGTDDHMTKLQKGGLIGLLPSEYRLPVLLSLNVIVSIVIAASYTATNSTLGTIEAHWIVRFLVIFFSCLIGFPIIGLILWIVVKIGEIAQK
jgi:hypothetical protein